MRGERVIDVSSSSSVPAVELRKKLQYLHNVGELDGGLAIVQEGVLVGLIPAPDLEFALDKLEDEDESFCLMHRSIGHYRPITDDGEEFDPTDFTPYVDPVSIATSSFPPLVLTRFPQAPLALDYHSPMNLVYQCFVKLGLRFICVLRDGQFAGLVHKKAFVKFVREVEKEGEH